MQNSVSFGSDWQQFPFSQCISKISIKHKIKQKDYLASGKYPVIDQGQSFISGYCDDEIAIKIKKPVIIFGDHTRCFKFVDFDFVAGADGIHILEPKDFFNEKLFYYFCLALDFPNKGYSRHFQYLAKTTMKIPPLEIQKRIVARLERAFEKIEKGSAHLQDAKTKLAKYKQSLLKSAFDGTLTAAASLRGVEKAETIHKVDCHDLTSSKLAMTDKENPKLPQGWTIKTLGEIAFVTKLAGFEYTKYIYPNLSDFGIPLFKGKNIQGNKLILKFESYIPKEISNQLERSKLNKKCILTPYVGSIGNVAIFDGSFEAHLGSNVGKIEILNNNAFEEYMCYFLQSGIGYLELTKHKKATAQESISIAAIRDVKIPLPPLETQKQIVKLLEKHLQHADKTGEFIESALNKAKQLKQSLLKSAFLGKLT